MVFDSFSPLTGFFGGTLIGLSAATLLIFNGDILGASGLISSFVVSPQKTLLSDPSQQWKPFFLVAFFITSRILLLIKPDVLNDAIHPDIPLVSSAGFLIGGFLVGFGTRLGNGCTTGHGICGMARLSIRSFVGVGSFMFSGFLFASVCPNTNPHVRTESTEEYDVLNTPTFATNVIVSSIIGVVAIFALIGLVRRNKLESPSSISGEATSSDNSSQEKTIDELSNNLRKIVPSIAAAIIFAVGLVISQMTLYSKIFGFLNLTMIPRGTWDPTLIVVMCGGLMISFLSYQWVQGYNLFKNSNTLQCPLGQKSTVGEFNVPTNKVIDVKLIIGEIIFGLGWGMAGMCPGPAMVLASAGKPGVLLRWWPMFFVGSYIAEKLKPLLQKGSGRTDVDCPVDEKINSSLTTVPIQNEKEYGTIQCV